MPFIKGEMEMQCTKTSNWSDGERVVDVDDDDEVGKDVDDDADEVEKDVDDDCWRIPALVDCFPVSGAQGMIGAGYNLIASP